MAALTRPTEATYACHENLTVDTTGTYTGWVNGAHVLLLLSD
jgi:hypothetical protein